MQHLTSAKSGASRLVAGAIVAGVLGASAILGRRNAPEPGNPSVERWYHRLRKPPFTPPDPIFGAVWPAFETGMAAGGYRLLRHGATADRNLALGLWLGTSAMIGGWTELFFRRHALAASTAAAGAMTAASAAYVVTSARVDRPAALAGVPLTAWLAFATVLANSVRRRNRQESAPR
jgi:tryptophan-rich sensory protein